MTDTLAVLQSDPTALALARWQFGLTTLYHYLFVPLTIGLMLIVAIIQTAWVRTGKVKYLQLTKLFGKIFLINFAMGVVTGIVQEFQFGLNWSEYSRFVGDIFGAPLAMEGLFAFFLEATFIGVWIFGWNKVSKGVHLASAWLTSIATILSAYFIIAANSFMQNPVGYELNPNRGRAELTDIGQVLTNPVAVSAFPHAITGAVVFAGAVIVAVSAYHLRRNQHVETMRTGLKIGAWSVLAGFAGVFLSGDQLGLAMVHTQPMKMAAAEAMFETSTGADASFSVFTLGTPDGHSELFSLRIPYLLSFLSTHTFNGTVEGLTDLQAKYTQQFCTDALNPALTCPTDGSFMPVLWITYWSFRWMIGLGAFSALIALVALWITRKKSRITVPDWFWRVAIWAAPVPLLANLVGWVFTEMGRQPWIVFGLMTTERAVSPNVPAWSVGLSLALFTLVYGALAVVEFKLIKKAAQAGPPEFDADHSGDETAEVDPHKLAITY
ncbi:MULTISPECIES: cytochrome ubiquinol oxidase subunit I [unclassified Pseudoclavibacter]|uniref:cytochrome ubiquinol oxidase subunit I n=1 Tax=unclassified Pseudoclavibacter TaxID=2615177 RepID=UPI001787D601|nr:MULTISPECIES: cytochrome ubiquinol oxidase subunit I [unclassified Pseudoclavibacter]